MSDWNGNRAVDMHKPYKIPPFGTAPFWHARIGRLLIEFGYVRYVTCWWQMPNGGWRTLWYGPLLRRAGR